MNVEIGTDVWYVVNEDGVISVGYGTVVEKMSSVHYGVVSGTGEVHLHLSRMHWTRESAYAKAKEELDSVGVRLDKSMRENLKNYMDLLVQEKMV